jgi:hypothetical protein
VQSEVVSSLGDRQNHTASMTSAHTDASHNHLNISSVPTAPGLAGTGNAQCLSIRTVSSAFSSEQSAVTVSLA